ncbi:MAG: DNA repair protein RecO [Acidobacteria bacterium]|nr:MAG: DNA repair protein RecO [Acidobacteriota bacterium]PYS85481.1 MAG: DNA repair protein RecO [Acidobacteriota bacterium]
MSDGLSGTHDTAETNMGLVETEAVVLHTHKLAEADKIAVCMTESAGLIRGVAHGARRLKSRFGAALEPFTLVNLTFFEKEARELVTIKSAEIIKSYFDAARDVEGLAALEYLAELVREFAPPHQPDPKLFRMLRACVDALAKEPENSRALLSYCELWVLKLAGFLPDYRVCAGCGKPLGGAQGGDVHVGPEGVLRCRICRQAGQAISAEAYRLLSAIRVSGPCVWSRSYFAVSARDQQTVSEMAQRLVRRVLEREPKSGKLVQAERPTDGPAGLGRA